MPHHGIRHSYERKAGTTIHVPAASDLSNLGRLSLGLAGVRGSDVSELLARPGPP
jgi:hypothetical protein